MRSQTLQAISVVALLLLLSACSDPPTNSGSDAGSTGSDSVSVFDGASSADVTVPVDGTTGADVTTTAKAVWLTFEVDDSANKSFADGDIKWTGSFTWDSKTNTIIPATSWLPTDGPYPLLYDDGPISGGGHEKEGAKAGDAIFGVAVKFLPTKDITFEYGALNEFDNWMWIGTNGQLKVKKGAIGTLDATALVLPKHGGIDLKLEIDTAKLNAKFSTWTSKTHKFYAKGTMNMWTPVQLLDDGKKGDEKALDGKLTFVQSKNLGKHDGLLNAKGEVQFIFVTTKGDAFPDAGQEYKAATEAYKDGIRAWANTGAGGAWVELTVSLSVDSKGKFKNTSVVMPAGSEKVCSPACKTGESCVEGTCKPAVAKVCTPLCKSGETCTEGTCVKDVIKTCTPVCKNTEQCVDGTCAAKTCKPACGNDQKCNVDVCVNLPVIAQVDPSKGPLAGGTKATITGKGFAAPAKVWFGGKAATDVVVKSATSITCTTPAGTTGAVKVEVEIAGDKAAKDAAFTYDAPPKPTALLIAPTSIAVEVGGVVKGLLAVIKVPTVSQAVGATAGLKVEFGYGAMGSDPTAKAAKSAKWTWAAATFKSENTAKGEEIWTADLGKLALGKYAFTVRASYATYVVYGDTNGSEDGMDPKKLGAIAVNTASTTPTVTGFDPPYILSSGGKITILGKNLTAKTKVSLVVGSVPPFPGITGSTVTVVPGKGISVTFASKFGPIPAYPGTLTVTPETGSPIIVKQLLDIVPFGTPTLDGVVTQKEWTVALTAAKATSEWGATNSISEFYVNYDKSNFYIGFKGSVEVKNAFVAYVDTDYGVATGVKSPADLKDNTGALDNAISNILKMLDGKFGAEFAFGTVGMASQTTGKAADSASAGWRDLTKPADFSWLTGKVAAKSGGGVEASISWAELFPKGIPVGGATVAIFIKVVNADGSVAPKNGALPDQKATDAGTIDTVVTVRVHKIF